MLLGSAVARTLGESLIRLDALHSGGGTLLACVAAASAAVLWGVFAWFLELPGSYTHSLLGGWLGGFCAVGGVQVVVWPEAARIAVAVLATPLIGLVLSWLAMKALRRAGAELSLQTVVLFRAAEKLLFFALSVAHGANAAQKSMALLVLAGFAYSRRWPWPAQLDFEPWVRIFCAAAFSFGVLGGFTRTLKKMGFGIFRVQTLHSVTALGVSAGLVLASTLAGLPLSAGQINSSALLGAGAGHHVRSVRWDTATDLAWNWILTFPISAVVAWVFVKVVE